MRRILILMILTSAFSVLNAQEFSIEGLYSGSSWKKYSHNFGYSIGYNQYFGSKNRLKIAFLHQTCNSQYDDIYVPESEDTLVHIRRYKPHNVLNSIHLQYGHIVYNRYPAYILMGPEIGLNYYHVSEEYSIVKDGVFQNRLKSIFEENHKFGFGLFIEMNFAEVLNKHIYISLSSHPEITTLESLGMKGSSLPMFVAWLRFNLGVRYKFVKN